jgi:hypothetical protein
MNNNNSPTETPPQQPTLPQIINLIYINMNTNPSLASTARKTLVDLSQHQMPLIISQALIALKTLLSEDIRSESKYQSNLDKLDNIIETIHESITTYKSSYKVDIYKQIHTFIRRFVCCY